LVGLVTPRRVAIVSAQLLGVEHGSGGVGAATAFLAIALARMGHDVRVLYIKEELPRPMDAEWARRYADAGVAIRHLPSLDVPAEPARFTRLRRVELALRADPPDVVIAHEYGGPAYFALRLRRLGLAFDQTAFVTYCHGTGPWVKEVTGNARIRPEMIAHTPIEQAAVELADVVVSPSGYMLDWMRGKGWRLPDSRVIPLVTRATAMDEPLSEAPQTDDRPVERLVFFGRLENIKGVEPFVRGLNALPPELLEGVELEFFGGATSAWDPDRVVRLMSEWTMRALQDVSFQTGLDQEQALARLRTPGTLAVIPSLAENSPNVVYECLEGRIPFLASAVGGIGELVAAEDRDRVLFPPTAEGIATALQRALVVPGSLRPVRPAFDGADILRAWGDVVAMQAGRVAHELERPTVDVVVDDDALEAQSYERVNVIRAATRDEGLRAATADWVIFLDGGDVPEPDLVDVLVRAQAASGADVVSCALRRPECEHFFVGEPGAAGLLENGYGTVALLRRSLLGDVVGDDWPLLARLNAAGAHVVSVPLPLVARTAPPGTLERNPGDALRVVDAFEAALPAELRPLARLAAGLAAGARNSPPPSEQGVSIRFKRLARRVRQGVRDSSAAIPAARRAAPRSGSGKTRSSS
jgi:glycosyltransferase involved in cell wall biosynthesis